MISKPIISTLLLTSIFTLFIGSTANAQWDGTSGKQYFMGNVGIGTSTPAYLLDIKGISNNDNLFRIKAYDSSSDYLSISNSTSQPSQFIPMIKGFHDTDLRQALILVGEIGSNNDAGSEPVMVFDSRLTGGEITARPLFGWASKGERKMIMDADGSLGISVSSPSAALHVASYKVDAGGTKLAAVLGNDWNSWTAFGSPNGGRIRGSGEGYLVLESNPNGIDRRVLINSKSSGDVLIAHGGGNVIVGSLDGVDISKLNSGFNLFVRKGIMAEKVKVALKSGWSDFVFEENYALPSLSKVESYIQENHHLQDIPSAKEVEENGINLGEMDAKLLQKIEELMLYTIEQEKAIKLQQSKIQKQDREISELKNLVNQLINKQ
ncbi:hypothetical protein R9C00_19585 [Flammeovirgaceae bacterium SG7u.111]|nr:hypothetical protein [Flammeovirgaceae bacterium SG7u.132]WPO33904.1 hypothetical protein R9C00_19585 [Flammeovirgaceae bacterium SG7u.111]